MDRSEKQQFVADFQEVLRNTSIIVVARYSGLNVTQMQKLRHAMREAGGKVAVVKNRLARIALEDTPFDSLSLFLKGPTLVAYSHDPVVAPKVAVAFAKEYEKFVIMGGVLVGSNALDPAGVKALAELPSLDELRARLIGLIRAPATKVVQLLQAPATKLVLLFMAQSEQRDT